MQSVQEEGKAPQNRSFTDYLHVHIATATYSQRDIWQVCRYAGCAGGRKSSAEPCAGAEIAFDDWPHSAVEFASVCACGQTPCVGAVYYIQNDRRSTHTACAKD